MSNKWLRAVQEQISDLAQLPADWDSYSSRPIQQPAINRAFEVAFCLSSVVLPRPLIVPVPGGGIQFEFDENGRQIEIECFPDGSVGSLIMYQDGVSVGIHMEVEAISELYDLCHWLHNSVLNCREVLSRALALPPEPCRIPST
jgi:hypothetical protein